ncbi:MAG TPA: cupin domain-containing protein [Beijerinckiaceae bacterium]|jgi:mannose-6-phosphate isomerase-like protein (cupin superfamily)|nr:cupin domain-containing protein [Beijerinckiaceae bacterium]
MIQKIKRYVTGHDKDGTAIVTYDDHAPNAVPLKGWPGAGVTEIWVTGEMPVDNMGASDQSLRPLQHDPVPSGTIFRVVEIPPEGKSKIDTAATFSQLGSGNQPTEKDQSKHPTMHKTNSVDYLVVISGEMWMVMEKGEVLLKAGDCIVQRGTNHAWKNVSDKPCLIAAVLVDAHPAP